MYPSLHIPVFKAASQAQPPPQQPNPGNPLQLPPALRSKNYCLFTTGQSFSLIGTWMTQIAQVWLVYHLTNSAFLLGVTGFVGQAATFVMTPFAGVLVDRWNLRFILLTTQILSLLQSLGLTLLAFSGRIDVKSIIILSILQGLVKGFDIPARQVLVPRFLTQKSDITNAIALNSIILNTAKFIGPTIAGLVIARTEAGFCFLADTLSYIPLIIILCFIQIAPPARKPAQKSAILKPLTEGFQYVFGFTPIKTVLMLLALISFMGMSYLNLMPVFTREALNGGPEMMGFLMTASGIGSLIAGIYLSLRKSILGLGKIIASATSLLGISLITLSFSETFPYSLFLTFSIGLSSILAIASINTFLQVIVEDDKRGRVMSLFTMCFMGTVPFGNLFAGCLTSQLGVRHTLLFGGACCVAGAYVFANQLPHLRRIVRPIYAQMGLLASSRANR